ncbi:MAG TPA: hypothetical protein VK589_00455 [Chryseolinea sp.]|nr:hypothetical protein [Chryseolinea sp.]
MIEVFKTDVDDSKYADILVEHIQRIFYGYEANFDLQDCDKILRIKNVMGDVNTDRLIKMLNRFGFYAEVLRDDYPAAGGLFILDLNHSILN